MPTPSPPPKPSDNSDEEAQRFIRILEQTGQLIDVAEGQDTTKLPTQITHVRYPDGRVKRIRFTSFGIQSGGT